MPSLAEAIEQYEADMDGALQARAAALEGAGDDMPGFGMNFDFAAMQAEMAKAREAGAQVRDVNETHERRIEVLFPEDRRGDFALAYKRRCFPEVYRASGASRSLRPRGSPLGEKQGPDCGLAVVPHPAWLTSSFLRYPLAACRETPSNRPMSAPLSVKRA